MISLEAFAFTYDGWLAFARALTAANTPVVVGDIGEMVNIVRRGDFLGVSPSDVNYGLMLSNRPPAVVNITDILNNVYTDDPIFLFPGLAGKSYLPGGFMNEQDGGFMQVRMRLNRRPFRYAYFFPFTGNASQITAAFLGFMKPSLSNWPVIFTAEVP